MKERSVDRKSERCGCGKVFEESCFSREQPPEEKRTKNALCYFHTHNTYYSIITFITREGGKNASEVFSNLLFFVLSGVRSPGYLFRSRIENSRARERVCKMTRVTHIKAARVLKTLRTTTTRNTNIYIYIIG